MFQNWKDFTVLSLTANFRDNTDRYTDTQTHTLRILSPHMINKQALCKESFFCFLNYLFCTGIQLTNNAVIVSGEQQKDWAIHTRVCILPKLPSRLPHSTEQSSGATQR